MATIRANVPLQIGLVSVPVNVATAVKDAKEEISLNTVCDGSGKDKPHTVAQIQSIYRCPLCSEENKEHMKKGRKTGSEFVLISEEELAKSILGKDDDLHRSMLLNIHPTEDVADVTSTGNLYYLAPTAASSATYNLLVRAFRECPEYTGIMKWAIKTKLAMYRLRVIGDILAIEKLAWPEDVVPRPSAPAAPVDDKQLAQAKMLMSMTASPFDLASYRDEQRADLASWIAAQDGVEGIVAADMPRGKIVTTSLEEQLAATIAAAKTPAAAEVKAKSRAKTTKSKTTVVESQGTTEAVEGAAKPTRTRKTATSKA